VEGGFVGEQKTSCGSHYVGEHSNGGEVPGGRNQEKKNWALVQKPSTIGRGPMGDKETAGVTWFTALQRTT